MYKFFKRNLQKSCGNSNTFQLVNRVLSLTNTGLPVNNNVVIRNAIDEVPKDFFDVEKREILIRRSR